MEDKPGVLTRVSSLFRRRAFNIESLTVGHTDRPGVSRMTIAVDTDELGARRLEAHIYKLVNVLRVENITQAPAVFRDLAMIKVAASAESRTHIMQLVDVFRARVVDVAPDSLIIEITGTEDKIDGLLEVLRPVRRYGDGSHRPRRDVARPAQTPCRPASHPACPKTTRTYFILCSHVSTQRRKDAENSPFRRKKLCASATLRQDMKQGRLEWQRRCTTTRTPTSR